jgi:hypothetical protein
MSIPLDLFDLFMATKPALVVVLTVLNLDNAISY